MLSPRAAGVFRLCLVVAYLVLAHLAAARHDSVFATLALGDILIIVLLRALLSRSLPAWTGAGLGALVLVASARTSLPLLAMKAVPAALIALAAYAFGHTLRAGRVPLITRLVAGLDAVPASALPPDLQTYASRLTGAWTALLVLLALLNLGLACVAPDGLFAGVGLDTPQIQLPPAWTIGLCTTVIVIGFFLIEFAIRQRRFPGRYRNLLDFLRKIGRLKPEFWRDVMH